MSEDASFVGGSSYGEKTVRKSHFVLIFFLLLIFVISILVGLYFLGASKKGSFKPIQVAPSPTAPVKTSTPTSTPTPVTLERSDLTITVLNGSGVAGAARGISTTLSDLGYTVKTVGNAKRFDYTGVTILITEEKKEYLDMLKKDLAEEAKTITTEIDNDLTVDAEVIVGK